MVRSTCRLIDMRNIRIVNVITFVKGEGDDDVMHEERYEGEGNTANRYNVLMNKNIAATVIPMYEVGANLGTYAGTLHGSAERAEEVAEHRYGEVVYYNSRHVSA